MARKQAKRKRAVSSQRSGPARVRRNIQDSAKRTAKHPTSFSPHKGLRPMSGREIDDGNEWSAMDLFDLHQHIQRGHSIEETARLLSRDIRTVRQKIEELGPALKMGRAR